MEEPTGSYDGEGLLPYINKLASYVSNPDVALLVFTQDAEALSQLLADDLDRLLIITEASHGILGQKKLMKQ